MEHTLPEPVQPLQVNPARLPFKNRLAASCVESLLGLKPLAALYDRWQEQAGWSADVPVAARFLDFTLNELETGLEVRMEERLQEIPREGPVIFCANHPLGGLEGILLARLLLKYRPDLQVLTNEILTLIPEFADLFIGVDVLSANSSQKNVKGMKKVSRHLARGGALLIFPSGIVASLEPGRGIVEKPWTSMLGRLACRYQAACMPLYVHGRNSRLFYWLGLIHPRLRTAMLARELNNKHGMRLQVTAGSLVKPAELARLGSDQAATGYLRLSCEALAHQTLGWEACPQAQPFQAGNRQRDADALQRQLDTLHDCLMLEKEEFAVYCVPWSRMGELMTELAYARERTFRAVGEGTGRELDSDRFDPSYEHLFIWDKRVKTLVGAYRIGRCNEIVARLGVEGLYSRSLFEYDAAYIERLGGALEVGRSFVSQEYQRNPRALDLLWRGIGTYVARNPAYHTLFGCVSISREHSRLARAFLSDTMLTCFAANPEFLTDVKPVAPLVVEGKVWTSEVLAKISDIAIINKLLGHFDEGKRIPVLLRHYLALNGRFVSFSVNHGFNEALDGLILVDLRACPVKYLQRYLGLEGSRVFLETWTPDESVA